MTKDYLLQQYVDHYIQAEIIRKLALSEEPVRFRDLKEDGIENSLFMYHANKLITRGLVAKEEAGFQLTLKGARWANFAGVHHSFTVMTPRPLIQFVIKKDHKLLLATRRGELKKLLNDYMLPGNIYQHGIPLQQNAKMVLRGLFEEELTYAFLTIAEVIHTYQDGFVNHVISHIFEVTGETPDQPLKHDLYDSEWVDISDIASDNPAFASSQFIPEFITRIPTLQSHETFIIEK